QKVGVCGRSGSGKSSLILATFRMIDQSLMVGQILVNGLDTLHAASAHGWVSFSLVAQAPAIWYASIRDNLDLENVHSDQKTWATLDQVGIKSAIQELPDKLETMLEGEGSLLSVQVFVSCYILNFTAGSQETQRQLPCLPRILLRKRRFVGVRCDLNDCQSSSTLDLETDKKIGEIIRSQFADCTVISIAHRIDTIVDSDLILDMEDSMLTETGTPTQLISRPDSRFSQLAASQGMKTAEMKQKLSTA
ncbi:P-loop containing nucleoside triphosphate hydrolase protein, partial [Mycena crocata]